MKVIAFSLFGDDQKYCDGAVTNAVLARLVYPDWRLKFYHDDTACVATLKNLAALGCELIRMSDANAPKSLKMAWRFLAANGDTVIFRDTDSLLAPKEAACVAEWERSGKGFHAIRDHAHHYSHPLFGGLWGTRKALPFSDWIANRGIWGDRLDDMLLLTEHVWPIAANDIMQHCGAGRERMTWGDYERMPGGEDYGLGAGVTAKW